MVTKIAFIGDIAQIGRYNTPSQELFQKSKDLSNYLNNHDFVIGNLEAPFTSKKGTLITKSMHLRSNPDNVQYLKYLNINIVSLANNHVYDYGRYGLDETMKILENNQISFFGVDEKYIEIPGDIRIRGYCCYSTNAYGYQNRFIKKGVHPIDAKKILESIDEDKKENKFSIYSMHWGDEHTNLPNSEHVNLARKMAETHKMIIHGHHPHVLQPIEYIDQSVAFYSLGNFIFDDCVSKLGAKMVVKQLPQNLISAIYSCEIDNHKIKSYEIKGVDWSEGFPKMIDISEDLRIINDNFIKLYGTKMYNSARNEQIYNDKFRAEKFTEIKNLSWYMRRCNYYSIGAKLTAILNKIRYKYAM